MKSMTIKIMYGTLLVIATSFTAAFAIEKPKPQPLDGKIKWAFDYEDGKRLSRVSGKPMFVVFRCER